MGHIVSLKTIKQIIPEIKNVGDRVVLTHGAFDILHIGHIEFLRESKEKGQVLIVGIESDKRIAEYKGISRPIIPFDQRMRLVSKIQFVDFVFPITDKNPFNDELYMKMYDNLQPNILTYGRNYGAEKQRKATKDYFTDIKFEKILTEFDKLQSTTKIIEKIITSGQN